MNAAGVQLYGGTSPEDLLGTEILDFIHRDYRDAVRQRIKRVIPDRQPVSTLEQQIVRLHGQIIDIEATGGPITYQGQPASQLVAQASPLNGERHLLTDGQLTGLRGNYSAAI